MVTTLVKSFFLFYHLQWLGNALLVIKWNLRISRRVKSKMQFSQLFVIFKTRALFLLTSVQYSIQKNFQADLSILFFILSIKNQFLTFITFILGLKLGFLLQHLKCKQKLSLHSKELQGLFIAYNSTSGTQI